MKIEILNVNDIIPYTNNAKEHPREQIEQIKNSIKMFENNDPIAIDENNIIIEGHGRFIALQELGYTEVECIRLTHLTDEEKDAYRLVHNQLTMNSGWDMDKLKEELAKINLDMASLGMDEQLLEELELEKTPVKEDEFNVDEALESIDEPICQMGDIWKLGKHYLMCGDSTSKQDADRLLKGGKVQLVVTDPPYNMDYSGAGNTPTEKREQNKILNDNMDSASFHKFLQGVYSTMFYALEENASFYVFYKELGEGVFITELEKSGLKFKQELIWVKNQLVLGGSKYQSMYEPCLYGCKGKVGQWYGGRKQRSVIEHFDDMTELELRNALKKILDESDTDIIRENKTLKNDLHPTMKPVKLLARFISNSSKKDDMVLDLFGGSGSTLIASEQLGRCCYMMELDPKYCDVIIKRWETFTGEKAEKCL